MLPDTVDHRRCPACQAPTAPDERFCPACGVDVAAERLAIELSPRMRRARGWILAVGIIYLATAALFVAIGRFPAEQATLLLAVNGALAAIHVGLWWWAGKQPFPAAVVALVLFLSVHTVNAIMDPMTIFQGLVVKIGMLLALSAAIRAGYEVVKLRGRPS